jgi:hypothetical protein
VTLLKRFGLVALFLLYLGVGLYCSRAFVPSDDEESYLALGRLAVTGAISLYQDELTGQRMPLPFYVLGVSQIVFGRDLWVGRLVSLLCGLAVVAFTVSVAARLYGTLGGFLAGLLLTSQGVVVGYYATAGYHAMTALVFMAAVWVLLKKDLAWRFAIGMAVASLLFWTRTNMFPVLPFFFAWAVCGAKTRLERAVVVLVATGSPAMFFAYDTTHLKVLAHVPLLHHLVEPLGYRSILNYSAVHRADLGEQFWALALLLRRFESLTIAVSGLVVAMLIALRRQPLVTVMVPDGRTGVLAALFFWSLLWHFVIWRVNFKYALPFFSQFAPVLAVLLGGGFTTRLTYPGTERPVKAVLIVSLVLASTISIMFIRHPLLPTPRPRMFDGDSIQKVQGAVRELQRLVPYGTRVFVFAPPITAYLAGLNVPIQQLMSPGGTLAAAGSDESAVAKSGVWGMAELERWLGREAECAVVSPGLVEALRTLRPEAINRIHELLDERFSVVGRVGDTAFLVSDVYCRRRSP